MKTSGAGRSRTSAMTAMSPSRSAGKGSANDHREYAKSDIAAWHGWRVAAAPRCRVGRRYARPTLNGGNDPQG